MAPPRFGEKTNWFFEMYIKSSKFCQGKSKIKEFKSSKENITLSYKKRG
jgi:hypothetical protein